MLGDKIGEESGKVTSQRVLPNPDGGPKMETSFQTTITLLGVKGTNRCTYWSIVRPDGNPVRRRAGIIVGDEGHMATWIGQGVGTMNKNGSACYWGPYIIRVPSAKWSRLNSVAAIYEYEADAEGNRRSEFWEWK